MLCLVFGVVLSPLPYIWYHMWVVDWVGGKAVIPWGPGEAPPSWTMCVMRGMSWFSSRVWCLQFNLLRVWSRQLAPHAWHTATVKHIHHYMDTHLYMYMLLGCWRITVHWYLWWLDWLNAKDKFWVGVKYSLIYLGHYKVFFFVFVLYYSKRNSLIFAELDVTCLYTKLGLLQ